MENGKVKFRKNLSQEERIKKSTNYVTQYPEKVPIILYTNEKGKQELIKNSK